MPGLALRRHNLGGEQPGSWRSFTTVGDPKHARYQEARHENGRSRSAESSNGKPVLASALGKGFSAF
jgi:hypothetical protein